MGIYSLLVFPSEGLRIKDYSMMLFGYLLKLPIIILAKNVKRLSNLKNTIYNIISDFLTHLLISQTSFAVYVTRESPVSAFRLSPILAPIVTVALGKTVVSSTGLI